MRTVFMGLIAIVAFGFATWHTAAANEVARFSNDWTGNDVVIDALIDPKVDGVTCHVTHFDRSFLDRLSKGNWFEDPSNSSIACRQTGPITIGDIELDEKGEEVFSERKSLIFKKMAVRRIYDRISNVLIYVVYSRKIVDGSAKMNVSTVALHGAQARWLHGKPQ